MFKPYLENINDSKKIFVCYVGKFNPFHNGHASVYKYLTQMPGISPNDVFICTQIKDTDFTTSEQKRHIIQLAGIPEHNIVNTSGYNIQKLASSVGATDNDILITAFSDKDLEDDSKSYFLKPPKDNVLSWRQLHDVNDIKYLRPINYVHKEYTDEKAEIKKQKGNAYFVVVPTQKQNDLNVSSSLIRQYIANNQWDLVAPLVNDKVFQYLKQIKLGV